MIIFDVLKGPAAFGEPRADSANIATPSLFFTLLFFLISLLLNRGRVSRGHIQLIDMRHSSHMDTSRGDICEMMDEFVVICKLLAERGRGVGVGVKRVGVDDIISIAPAHFPN